MSRGRPELTHAGALAVRMDRGKAEFLVVSASDRGAWVLPKGHIRPGESAEAAALRELMEESGVRGVILASLATRCFKKGQEEVVVRYFLVEALSFGPSPEGRSVCWEVEEAALARLSFEDARAALREGATRLREEPE